MKYLVVVVPLDYSKDNKVQLHYLHQLFPSSPFAINYFRASIIFKVLSFAVEWFYLFLYSENQIECQYGLEFFITYLLFKAFVRWLMLVFTVISCLLASEWYTGRELNQRMRCAYLRELFSFARGRKHLNKSKVARIKSSLNRQIDRNERRKNQVWNLKHLIQELFLIKPKKAQS